MLDGFMRRSGDVIYMGASIKEIVVLREFYRRRPMKRLHEYHSISPGQIAAPINDIA